MQLHQQRNIPDSVNLVVKFLPPASKHLDLLPGYPPIHHREGWQSHQPRFFHLLHQDQPGRKFLQSFRVDLLARGQKFFCLNFPHPLLHQRPDGPRQNSEERRQNDAERHPFHTGPADETEEIQLEHVASKATRVLDVRTA